MSHPVNFEYTKLTKLTFCSVQIYWIHVGSDIKLINLKLSNIIDRGCTFYSNSKFEVWSFSGRTWNLI